MLSLFLPLALASIAALLVAAVGRYLAPRTASWLGAISITAVFIAVLGGAWTLSLGFLAHEPATAPFMGWCRDALEAHHPISRWAGGAAIAVSSWTTVVGLRVGREWRRHRGTAAGEVFLIESPSAIAFAQTGREGAVVVSTAMLSGLQPDERTALIAHERAHLRHRHDRFLVVCALAASFPPLAIAVKQLRHTLERWADEEAARAVGDRTIVARAVARAALMAHGEPVGALAIQGANVPARVEAMLRPPAATATTVCWAALTTGVVSGALAASTLQLHHLALLAGAICPS